MKFFQTSLRGKPPQAGALICLLAIAVFPWVAGKGRALEDRPAPQVSPRASAPSASDTGFQRAMGTRIWKFPADHGQHPAYRLEWWYYTGNLKSPGGRRFGYQLTFFRRGLAPNHTRPSAWAVRSLYLAHGALSDLNAGRFYSAGRVGRDGAGGAGAAADRQRVRLNSWRAEPLPDDPHGVRLVARGEDFSFNLTLRAGKPPVLHGENGLDRKGGKPGQATWYYSLPRLATEGWVESGGERHRVAGTSWMDHEFGTNQLGDGQIGWDWFALRLDNGEDLMLYRLRRADGSADPISGGSWIASDGSRQALSLSGSGESAARLTPLRWWISPRSGARYPVEWRVELTGRGLTLRVTAEMDGQELTVGRGVPFSYWEGAVRVVGRQGKRRVRGEGYMELTGYSGNFRKSLQQPFSQPFPAEGQ